MPEAPRLEEYEPLAMLLVLVSVVPYPEEGGRATAEAARELARPRVRNVDFCAAGCAARFLSSSSAFRAAAALRSCSSTSRLCAICCFACASASISAIS